MPLVVAVDSKLTGRILLSLLLYFPRAIYIFRAVSCEEYLLFGIDILPASSPAAVLNEETTVSVLVLIADTFPPLVKEGKLELCVA